MSETAIVSPVETGNLNGHGIKNLIVAIDGYLAQHGINDPSFQVRPVSGVTAARTGIVAGHEICPAKGLSTENKILKTAVFGQTTNGTWGYTHRSRMPEVGGGYTIKQRTVRVTSDGSVFIERSRLFEEEGGLVSAVTESRDFVDDDSDEVSRILRGLGETYDLLLPFDPDASHVASSEPVGSTLLRKAARLILRRN